MDPTDKLKQFFGPAAAQQRPLNVRTNGVIARMPTAPRAVEFTVAEIGQMYANAQVWLADRATFIQDNAVLALVIHQIQAKMAITMPAGRTGPFLAMKAADNFLKNFELLASALPHAPAALPPAAPEPESEASISLPPFRRKGHDDNPPETSG